MSGHPPRGRGSATRAAQLAAALGAVVAASQEPASRAHASSEPASRPRDWFASWACNCTDIEPSRDMIPERCPNHDETLIGRPEALSTITRFTYGVRPARPS